MYSTGCMAASLWPVLDMRCVAEYAGWVAGNSKMPYETGFIIVATIIDASLPLQPLSLRDGAVFHAHAGLTIQSNDLLLRHTSLVCHATSSALAPQTSNMKALPPGAYSKPGGRTISSAGPKVQPLAVRVQMQPAALPPGAYIKLGGRATSSDYNRTLRSSKLCETHFFAVCALHATVCSDSLHHGV